MTRKPLTSFRRRTNPMRLATGKPPKHTQFKPGQSGNPRGRPRGQRNFRTVVKEALKKRSLSARVNGHARSRGWTRSCA